MSIGTAENQVAIFLYEFSPYQNMSVQSVKSHINILFGGLCRFQLLLWFCVLLCFAYIFLCFPFEQFFGEIGVQVLV